MVTRAAELVDSCILIDLLDIPHEAESHAERKRELDTKASEGVQLYLPLASVIETGQHVQRIADGNTRRDRAQRYERFLRGAVNGTAPWSFSPLTWDESFVEGLLQQPFGKVGGLVDSLARGYLEMGDLTIITELIRMRKNLVHVTFGIWTRDSTLAAQVNSL